MLKGDLGRPDQERGGVSEFKINLRKKYSVGGAFLLLGTDDLLFSILTPRDLLYIAALFDFAKCNTNNAGHGSSIENVLNNFIRNMIISKPPHKSYGRQLYISCNGYSVIVNCSISEIPPDYQDELRKQPKGAEGDGAAHQPHLPIPPEQNQGLRLALRECQHKVQKVQTTR